MGRTLPSATMLFQHEEASLQKYRRALRKADQFALDQLLDFAQKHIAEAGYAANQMPFQVFLLSMLLEEHKKVSRLEAMIEKLTTMLPAEVEV